jgi:hypothetical protein
MIASIVSFMLCLEKFAQIILDGFADISSAPRTASNSGSVVPDRGWFGPATFNLIAPNLPANRREKSASGTQRLMY